MDPGEGGGRCQGLLGHRHRARYAGITYNVFDKPGHRLHANVEVVMENENAELTKAMEAMN